MFPSESQSGEELLPLLYDDLRKLAAQLLAGERAGHTLQPTALVHEADLRLAATQGWQSRAHFFAAASRAMRQILVESARRKKQMKHGGDFQRTELDDACLAIEQPAEDVIVVDEALEHLAQQDAQAAHLVTLLYFGGLTTEEAAAELGISVRTAYRDWAFARAWLYRYLNRN